MAHEPGLQKSALVILPSLTSTTSLKSFMMKDLRLDESFIEKPAKAIASGLISSQNLWWTCIDDGAEANVRTPKDVLSSCFADDLPFNIVNNILSSSNLLEALVMVKHKLDEANQNDLIIWCALPNEGIEYVCKQVFNSNSYTITIEGEPDNSAVDEKMLSLMLAKQMQLMPAADAKEISTLQSPLIDGSRFCHGFTTRCGGVSSYGTMKSLNIVNSPAKKDTLLFVQENRRRLAKKHGFCPASFEMAKAVHGADVWVIGETQPSSYDAIATNTPGVTVAAPGADCTTILFCDPVRSAVAAAHSGWKGTLAGIAENVIKTMTAKFGTQPQDILVALGPSLGPCCFEVNQSLADQFAAAFSNDVVRHPADAPRPFVDLWQSITMSLLKAGILKENIDNGKRFPHTEHAPVTRCTKCPENKDLFFSYRRDGKYFGNQCAFIGITG